MQMIEFNMLSKSDFEKYKSESKSDFEIFKSEVYHRFEKIDDKLNRLALQLTIKLGVMLALSVGLLSTILAIKL